jgi:beta-lactamase regulating signal transducer with metallopeptidase domain
MVTVLLLPTAHAVWPPATVPTGGTTGVADRAVRGDGPSHEVWLLPESSATAVPWLAGAIAAIAAWRVWRLGRAMTALRQLRARCVPCPDDLERRLPLWLHARRVGRSARLEVSPDLDGPALLGGASPVIALPRWMTESLHTGILDAGALDLAVLHEHAHLVRRDDRDLLVQASIEAVFAWHPAVWLIARRLDVERERACDDQVVRRTGRPAQYARCLLDLAAQASRGRQRAALPVAGIGRPGRALTARIERLAAGASSVHAAFRAGVVLGAAVALAACVIVSATLGLRVSIGFAAPLDPGTASPAAATPRASNEAPLDRVVPAPAVDRPAIGVARPKPAAGPAPRTAARTAPPGQPARASDIVSASDATAPGDVALDTRTTYHAAPSTMVSLASAPVPRLLEAPAPDTSSFDLTAVAMPHPAAPPMEPPTPTKPDASDPGPWKRTADAGESIGRGAARAGVKTAGFFTRMGRAIASSF